MDDLCHATTEDELVNEVALLFHDAMTVRCVPSDYAKGLIAKVRLFDMRGQCERPKTNLNYAEVLLAIDTLPFTVIEIENLKAALAANPSVQYQRHQTARAAQPAKKRRAVWDLGY